MAALARLGAVCASVVVLLCAHRAPAQPASAEPVPSRRDGASAESESTATVLPTLTPTGDQPSALPLRQPGASAGILQLRARELDAVLRDAAQDLGLTVVLADSLRDVPSNATESKLVQRAVDDKRWMISPRLEIVGDKWLLRLVLVPAGSNVALSRVEFVDPAELHVRAVVMLRDLVRAGQGKAPPMSSAPPEESAEGGRELAPRNRRRSEGRAILALNAAALGGFVGYSLQKSGGSDDARLTYPLLALGTGIGVGGSLIVAEEWDVGVGDAWYLSAGVVWPTAGGLLLAKGRDVQPSSDRYTWGLVGGLGGLTLASISLTFRGMGEAGATITHSGGLLGIGLGAGTEALVRGSKTETPYQGMGYGAIAGTVVAGAIARKFSGGSVSRVMMIDVGAGLGALSVAAVASPLLIGEDVSEPRQRVWVSSTMCGAVAGGVIAWWITDDAPSKSSVGDTWRYGRPQAGVIGVSSARDGRSAPAYGVSWAGTF